MICFCLIPLSASLPTTDVDQEEQQEPQGEDDFAPLPFEEESFSSVSVIGPDGNVIFESTASKVDRLDSGGFAWDDQDGKHVFVPPTYIVIQGDAIVGSK